MEFHQLILKKLVKDAVFSSIDSIADKKLPVTHHMPHSFRHF